LIKIEPKECDKSKIHISSIYIVYLHLQSAVCI